MLVGESYARCRRYRCCVRRVCLAVVVDVVAVVVAVVVMDVMSVVNVVNV